MALTPGIHWFSPTLPLHVLDAPAQGPTALIQAGIHGDEVAGVHAIQELLEADFRPTRGRLILVPVMNPRAYRERNRMADGGLDLNRCFPGDANGSQIEQRLAFQFMQLVLNERPALVATLHESWKTLRSKRPPLVWSIDCLRRRSRTCHCAAGTRAA